MWIADTCIECDRQRFGGFLKVFVEELLIALRDDRHRLHDPAGLFSESYGFDEAREAVASEPGWSLYPDGLGAERLAEVIETDVVWKVQTATRGSGALLSTDVQDAACGRARVRRGVKMVLMLVRGRTSRSPGVACEPEG